MFTSFLQVPAICGLSPICATMNMLGLQEGFPYPTVFTTESGRHFQMQMGSMAAMKRKRVRVRVNPS